MIEFHIISLQKCEVIFKFNGLSYRLGPSFRSESPVTLRYHKWPCMAVDPTNRQFSRVDQSYPLL